MEDPDLILTVTAADLAADNALSLLHNQSRYEPEDEVGDYASRQSTPFPDIEDNSCRLQLKFDRRPKDIRQGFVFGTDPRTCDVLIGTKETSISRRHFCITFDGDGRLVLKDISKCGTAVSYNGQAEREVRQHFTWILFKGYELKVHLQLARKRFTAFMITVANHEDCKAEYQAHLRSYLDDSRNAVPPLGLLNIHSQASTRAPTQPLSPRQRPIYLQGEELGSGTFGAVYRATDVSTGDFFAAKRFNTKSGFEMEVEILKSVCHEHIVQFIDFRDEQSPLLIMEYLPLGNLASQHSIMPITSEENGQILIQGLHAIDYLHARKITHRDIKPENILVQCRGSSLHIKMADFGLSKNMSFLKTRCGSPMYAAPEIWGLGLNSHTYGKGVDLWSFGVVVLQYAGGLPRRSSYNRDDLAWCQAISEAVTDAAHLENRQYTQGTLSAVMCRAGNKPMLCLLSKMLQMDPRERPAASDCLLEAEYLQVTHSRSSTPTEGLIDESRPGVSARQIVDFDPGTVQSSGWPKRQRSSSESATRVVSSRARGKRLLTADSVWRSPGGHMRQSRLSGDHMQHTSALLPNTDLGSSANSFFTQSSLLSTQRAEEEGITYPDEFRSITNISGCSLPR